MGKGSKIDTSTAVTMTCAEDTAAAPFELNPSDYSDDLADLGLTEEQQRVFLETLLSILSTFVELGFKADVCSVLFRDFQDVSRPGETEVGSLPSSTQAGADAIQKGHGAS